MKVRFLPECSAFGSIVFPTFKAGVQCLNEVSVLCLLMPRI